MQFTVPVIFFCIFAYTCKNVSNTLLHFNICVHSLCDNNKSTAGINKEYTVQHPVHNTEE